MIVKKVNEENREDVLDWLKRDSLRHFWEIYDLTYNKQEVMYVAYEQGLPKGLLLIWKNSHLTARLDGEDSAASELLEQLPSECRNLFTPRKLVQIVQKKFSKAQVWRVESQMYLRRGNERLLGLNKLSKKLSPKDEPLFEELCTSVNPQELPATLRNKEIRKELIEKQTVYGIFFRNKIVSTVGAIKIPGIPVVMMGGLFTHPRYRNKGFATSVRSAVIRELFKDSSIKGITGYTANPTALKISLDTGSEKIAEWYGIRFP